MPVFAGVRCASRDILDSASPLVYKLNNKRFEHSSKRLPGPLGPESVRLKRSVVPPRLVAALLGVPPFQRVTTSGEQIGWGANRIKSGLG
jgi:hypothetical protein